MGLIRFLIIVVAIWVVIILIRSYLNRKPKVKQDKQTAVDSMVRCAHCGLHIPDNEAIQRGEHYFCCQEHADKTP